MQLESEPRGGHLRSMRAARIYLTLCVFLLSISLPAFTPDFVSPVSIAEEADLYGSGSAGKSSADDAFTPARRGEKTEHTDVYGAGDSRRDSPDASSPGRSPSQDADAYGVGTPRRKTSVDDAISPARRGETSEQNDTYGIGKPGKASETSPDGRRQRGEGEEAYTVLKDRRALFERMVVINRPPNIQGQTGLLVTNSAFTQKPGNLAAGISLMAEYSGNPDYSILQLPVTLTYGLTDDIELGIKAKALQTENVNSTTTERGLGDSEIAVKWRFIDQSETFPAVAVGIVGMLPTGDEDKGLNEVVNWGVKVSALASSEAPLLEDYYLGLYVEAQAVFIDELVKGSKTPGAERYGYINLGMLFPVALDGHLQAIIEYNQLLYKNNWRVLYERNFNALTPALRYVTDRFSMSVGAQAINKDAKGWDNTIRFIGTLSYTF